MRRTTICRSSGVAILGACAALVLGGIAAAQQPPSPPAPQQRPAGQQPEQARPQQPTPAGQQPTPARPRQPAAPQEAPPSSPSSPSVILPGTPQVAQGSALPPASHVVQQGETLWSLAQQFLGDPLLWPEIYRLNTAVVEDPHWIFPGEELRLVPEPAAEAQGPPVEPQALTVTPSSDTARPVARAAQLPTVFAANSTTPRRQTQEQIEFRVQRAYRAVRPGEYYSAGFLTEGQTLPAGRSLGNAQAPSVGHLTAGSTAMPYTDVAVEAAVGDTLHAGDLLLSFTTAGQIRGYGDVIVPSGLMRVKSEQDQNRRAVATVVSMYGQVTDGQGLLKVTPFRFPSNAHPEPVADGMAATVVGSRDGRVVGTLQDVIFINRGSEDGVRLGDIFAISDVATGDGTPTERSQARALVVNTRPHTSSLIIVQLDRPDIRAGAMAKLIRRIPS